MQGDHRNHLCYRLGIKISLDHCMVMWIPFTVTCFIGGVVHAVNITTTPYGVTVCTPSLGYPEYCPRSWESSDLTKCCRDGRSPACCEERADKICAKTSTGRVTGIYSKVLQNMNNVRNYYNLILIVLAGKNWYMVFCPQPGQPDSYTACCYKNNDVYCCDMKM